MPLPHCTKEDSLSERGVMQNHMKAPCFSSDSHNCGMGGLLVVRNSSVSSNVFEPACVWPLETHGEDGSARESSHGLVAEAGRGSHPGQLNPGVSALAASFLLGTHGPARETGWAGCSSDFCSSILLVPCVQNGTILPYSPVHARPG